MRGTEAQAVERKIYNTHKCEVFVFTKACGVVSYDMVCCKEMDKGKGCPSTTHPAWLYVAVLPLSNTVTVWSMQHIAPIQRGAASSTLISLDEGAVKSN